MSDEENIYTDDFGEVYALTIRAFQEQRNRFIYETQNLSPSPSEIELLDTRADVPVHVETIDSYDLPNELEDVIERLQEALERVPAKYRASATIDVESEYESSSVALQIGYRRPETNKEWADRKADVRRRQELHQTREADNERAEYERLKAKFEE